MHENDYRKTPPWDRDDSHPAEEVASVSVEVVRSYDDVRTGLGEPCQARLLTVEAGGESASVVAVRRRDTRPHPSITDEPTEVTEAWAFEVDGDWSPRDRLPDLLESMAGDSKTELFHWTGPGSLPWSEVIDSVRDHAHRVLM